VQRDYRSQHGSKASRRVREILRHQNNSYIWRRRNALDAKCCLALSRIAEKNSSS